MRAWLTALLLAGCGSATAPTPPPRLTPPTPTALRFDPQGAHLIVDEAWRVRLSDGRVEALAAHPAARVLFAADGRIAQLSPRRVWIDGRRVPLPVIQTPPVPDQEVHGVWLDLERLYVHEWHPVKRSGACRIYDRRTGGLTRPAKCLTAARPMRLQGGPGDLIFLVEAHAAGPVAALVRYDPETGARPIWRADLRPDGTVHAAFDSDGGAVHIVTRCAMDRPRPCVDPRCSAAPFAFRYDMLDAAWRRREALPAGAVPGPAGRIAWPVAGGFCVADGPSERPQCRLVVPDG